MNPLKAITRWLTKKSTPPITSASTFEAAGYIDQYRRKRQPSTTQLIEELRHTAWSCATINASTCASFPPKLYVTTQPGQPEARCHKRPLSNLEIKALSNITGRDLKAVGKAEEVLDHPLITLFKTVNPEHNSFDLWYLTELYLEVAGSAYWLLDDTFLGVPTTIWILPSHRVRPVREAQSKYLIDYYEFHHFNGLQRYSPQQIIHFKFPDPKDPYSAGLSPLRSCYEQVLLTGNYNSMRQSIYENTALPSVIISPDEVVGEEERLRLEEQWQAKFRRGGQGKALVAESKMNVNVLSHSMGDLAALSEAKATKEDIANAFHVPIPYLSGETNLANMEAADLFHQKLAIKPRLKRRDEKINERLIPVFDPSGRLFVASEDPGKENQAHLLEQQKADLQQGVRSINEVRADRGLPPVVWGELPYPQMPQPQGQPQ